jgi:hypothetical protein
MDAAETITFRLQRFSIEDARGILKLGRTTLWRRIRGGQIEVQRDGARIFVTGDAIAAYQQRMKVPEAEGADAFAAAVDLAVVAFEELRPA